MREHSERENTGRSTDAPMEFVADLVDGDSQPPARTHEDFEVATDELGSKLLDRLSAVLGDRKERPALLLSGGVDSIVVAAGLKKLDADPYCVTIEVQGCETGEGDRAKSVAELLGFDHEVVLLSLEDVADLARRAQASLDSSELWEVAAYIPIRAAFDHLDQQGVTSGPVFTGGGADVLLGGGKKPPLGLDKQELRAWTERAIWNEMLGSFTYERLIPDFFARTLGPDESRFIEVFQTVEMWEFTSVLGPEVLFKTSPLGDASDKACVRELAAKWGIPVELAWGKKDPMQNSSGVFLALELLGRKLAANAEGALSYTSPLDEPAERVVARLWLLAQTDPS